MKLTLMYHVYMRFGLDWSCNQHEGIDRFEIQSYKACLSCSASRMTFLDTLQSEKNDDPNAKYSRTPRQSDVSTLVGEPLPSFIGNFGVFRILFLVTQHTDPNVNIITIGQIVSILNALESQEYVVKTLCTEALILNYSSVRIEMSEKKRGIDVPASLKVLAM